MADEQDDRVLAAVASALEGYPSAGFRDRVRRSLERSIEAMVAAGPAIAEAGQAVIPYVMVQDIEPIIAFVKATFDAQEVQRGTGSAGGVHVELRVGDSRLMFGGATPRQPVSPRIMGFHVYVPDADAVYARAVAAGGTSLGEPHDTPYGERSGYVQDPAGNHWYIATRLGETYFAAEPRTVTPHLYFRQQGGRRAAEFIAFGQAAFGATVDMRHDEGDRVAHAVLRVHGSALEFSEGDRPGFAAPAAFVLNVQDVDAAYAQALAAGATALFPPAAQSFGGTMAGVKDPWGNEWYIAAR